MDTLITIQRKLNYLTAKSKMITTIIVTIITIILLTTISIILTTIAIMQIRATITILIVNFIFGQAFSSYHS